MRKTIAWSVLVCLLIAGIYLLLIRAQKRAGRQNEGSTYSAVPKGYKAAYLFLRESGVKTGRRTKPWDGGLPARGLLVMAAPSVAIAASEQTALEQWVAAGGTLLLAADSPWQYWPVSGKSEFGSFAAVEYAPLVPTGLTRGVDRFRLTAVNHLRGPYRIVPGSAPPVVIAGDQYGAVIMLVAAGQGRVVLVSDRGFLCNERLKTAPGHALFLLNLARSFGIEAVEFDEYHLGYGRHAAAETAVPLTGLPEAMTAFLWQLVLLIGLYFFALGRRFGRPAALPETGGRTITEYITSLATLYQRADANLVVLNHLYHGLLERMRLLTGLSAHAGLDLLAAAAAGRLGKDPEDLRRLLFRCQSMLQAEARPEAALSGAPRVRLTQAELLSLAKKIDYYRKELEKWVTLPR